MALRTQPGQGRWRVLLAAALLGSMVAGAAPAAPGGPSARATDGLATIAHADDGVVFRAEPAFGSEVLDTLANGTVVELRTDSADTVHDPDGQTRWWPVSAGGEDGWVAGYYLEIGDVPSPAAAAPPDLEPATGGAASEAAIAAWKQSTPALIDGDGGWNLASAARALVTEADGVNLRQEPGLAGEALRVVPAGAAVDLRIGSADTVYVDGSRWWPVSMDGLDGWISGDYLSPDDGSAPAADPAAVAETTVAQPARAIPGFAANDYVEIATDDGSGLNIRADGAPDAERIGFAAEGDVVQVMDGPSIDPLGNPWFMVTDGDVTGWVFGEYLAAADGPPPPDDEPAAEAAGDGPFDDSFPFGDDDPFGEGFPFGQAGVATGSFMYPVADFTFTQGYGCSPYWFEPWESAFGCNFHNGIDLAANTWTPVMAADGGIVELAGWCDCGLGWYVKIDHGNGFKTVYGHLQEYYVLPGEAVAKGQEIAALGSTGNSTGPHLHFITQLEGVTYDPLWYLP